MTAFQLQDFTSLNTPQGQADLFVAGESHSSANLAQFDMIDQLLGQFRQREMAIDATKDFFKEAVSMGVMSYFIDGANLVYGSEYRPFVPTDSNSAKASLRIEFWNRLLNEAKIFDVMPTAKREKARNQFAGLDCPPFDESTVRPTMEDLMQQRSKFFAERVDGVFFSLSGDHVTNSPAGFSKKMILANVLHDGYVTTHKGGVIGDLRGVVGRLSGRGEPSEYGTRQLLGKLHRDFPGKKTSIDGGAFHVTVFKNGNVHLEVTPEVAVLLNSILASLYPMAIPASFRTSSKKPKTGAFELKMKRLPMGVIDLLTCLEYRRDYYSLYTYSKSKEFVEQTVAVLEEIGAEISRSSDGHTLYVNFDYEPRSVLDQLIFSGVVPEQASFQFYPTRSVIAEEAAMRLDITPGRTYYEPSAGTGDLAQYLPIETTTCIELADVRAKVLAAKGFTTIKADFLLWASENADKKVSGILMNPPFSKGRALAHLIAASTLLVTSGRLVAILPASMVNTNPLEGFEHDWSEVFVDQFEGTAVRVVILTAQRLIRGGQ